MGYSRKMRLNQQSDPHPFMHMNPLSRNPGTAPAMLIMQSSRKRRITRIGTHVFSLGRMIFARRESRVRMFF